MKVNLGGFIGLVAVFAIVYFPALPGIAGQSASEYEVKAACLYNLAQFVEWPAGAFAGDKSPIIIGILGTDPFGEMLDRMLKDNTVNGRHFVVKRFARLKDLGDCHILFVGSSESDHLGKVFDRLRGKNVLSVGESERFIHSGGIVRLATEKDTVGLEICVDHANKAGLKISSRLLKLAKIVDG